LKRSAPSSLQTVLGVDEELKPEALNELMSENTYLQPRMANLMRKRKGGACVWTGAYAEADIKGDTIPV
jgi:hypothetical protein